MLHHRYHMATAKGYNRSPRNKNNENIPEAKHDTPTIIDIIGYIYMDFNQYSSSKIKLSETSLCP